MANPKQHVDKVLIFKLVNGVDLIATWTGLDNSSEYFPASESYRIEKALMLVLAKAKDGYGIQFVPYTIGANDDVPGILNRNAIACILEPEQELLNSYNQSFSNLVVPPQQKQLITL